MADEADYARRLLSHRVPALSDAAIAEAFGVAADEGAWAEVIVQILDVVGALEARLNQLGADAGETR